MRLIKVCDYLCHPVEYFKGALLISLAAHGIILFQHGPFASLVNKQKDSKVEISYIKKTEKKPIERSPKGNIAKRDVLLKLPSRITLQGNPNLSSAEKEKIFRKDNSFARADTSFPKPEFNKPDIISVKKKITLPPVDMEKIDNPSYISYYQVVREKIKRAAYQNYTRTETGEVYATFIVSMDGMVRDARIAEDKPSGSNKYLREVALKSIKDAAPLPNFPKELEYPQLSFNVIISFEVE